MSLRQFVLNLATLPLKVVFISGWFALFLVWERFLPAARRPRNLTLTPAARLGGNITLGAISAVLWASVTCR